MSVACALLLLLVVTLDAVRFHLPELLHGRPPRLDAHGITLVVMLLIEAAVLWRAGRAFAGHARLQGRLLRLPVGRVARVAGADVLVVPGTRPLALCAGFIRPRIFVTEGAILTLADGELEAVVAHEAAHARRRDPLRAAVVGAVGAGFGFVGPLRLLAERQAVVSELAADAAAMSAAGARKSLAAALLRLQDPHPARVEQLAGRPPASPPRLALASMTASTVALGIGALAVVLAGSDPALPLLLLPALWLPAVLAARTTG